MYTCETFAESRYAEAVSEGLEINLSGRLQIEERHRACSVVGNNGHKLTVPAHWKWMESHCHSGSSAMAEGAEWATIAVRNEYVVRACPRKRRGVNSTCNLCTPCILINWFLGRKSLTADASQAADQAARVPRNEL